MFLLIAGAALLAACSKPPPPPEEIRLVRTLVAQMAPAETDNVFAGDVRPRYESSLGFRVAGKIASRQVNVGDTVKTGQVLAQLDAKDLSLNQASSRAAVAAQVAQLAIEAADLERFRKLVDEGFVSHAEFDRQQTKVKAAQAQLDSLNAQERVSANQTGYAELRADHDGTITAIEAEAGQVVSAGQPVAKLARSGEMEVAVNVPEYLVRALKVGQPVKVALWTAAGKTYPGRLRELSSSADAATRTYGVRIAVDQAPPEMKLGMTATVRIPRAGVPDVIRMPLSAYVEREGVQGVWIVDPATSTVALRQIQLAGFSGSEALVAAGIKPGELIVTAGAPLLAAGQKVRPLSAVAIR